MSAYLSGFKKLNSLKLPLELFYVSFVMLFLELILIRWVASEVRIFAYLKNFVLIACFLGIGIGCFQSKQRFDLHRSVVTLVLMIFLILEPGGIPILPFKKITLLASEAFNNQGNFWDIASKNHSLVTRTISALAAIILTVLLFGIITSIFNAWGRRLGALFDQYQNSIPAYSINILGSLCGSLTFVLISFCEWPAWLWFLTYFILLIPYAKSGRDKIALVISIFFVVGLMLLADAPSQKTYWSPYQKLSLSPVYQKGTGLSSISGESIFGYQLDVNNTGYQILLNLSYDRPQSEGKLYKPKAARLGHYEVPYHLAKNPKNILIVGGGTGNDAASAIRHGLQEIDCVEIDPTIIKIGEAYHPEKPYDNPRVNIINDDARAFFERAKTKYDLIWFGLADAHTVVSGYTNLRLDHFLYTKESLEKAKSLLSKDGVLVIAFEVGKYDWVASRFYHLLHHLFGKAPLSFELRTPGNWYGAGGYFYITGHADIEKHLKESPEDIRAFIEAHQVGPFPPVKETTDDWPFLYLEKARVPLLYWLVSLAILICFGATRRYIWAKNTPLSIDWKFFFLGAGFMLLEVQAVTKAGLLFGSTWIVNSFIISQILIWILLSNALYARWKPKNLTVVYMLLFVSIGLLYVVPIHLFHRFGFFSRMLWSSLFLTCPIFLAGILFIHYFSSCQDKPAALGSNLFGALIGGLMESLSMAWGFQALLIPTALLYGMAWMASKKCAIPPKASGLQG